MRISSPRPLAGRPTVSVVIPCFNYGHYLPSAVGSVLAQSDVELEVIIVDDCSTDGSEQVAKELESEHEQVRLIQNAVNMRHIATYNTGLAEVTGQYVALLSADDMLAAGALARAAALFEAHPNVELVYGWAPSFSDTPPAVRRPPRSWSTWRGEEWLARVCSRADNVIVNPEAVVRRTVLDRFGGYDATFPHAADMLLWMQAAATGDVGRVNGIQAFYREHGSNMHSTDFAGTLTDMRERAAVFAAFFGPHGAGSTLSRALELDESARRAIAIEALRCAVLATESDSDIGGNTPEAFAEFAVSLCPAITSSRPWRAYGARSAGVVHPLRDQAARAAYSLRWKLRWRRWRRWGL